MKCCRNYRAISVTFTIICLIFVLIVLNFSLGYSTPITKESQVGESYWSTAKSMSEDRNELTAVVLDGMIYAMGGEDIASGGDRMDTVEVYHLANEEWIEKDIAPMPLPLEHSASAVYQGKIYVAGGFLDRKVPTDKLFIYDPTINEWYEGKSLPTPIGAALNAEFVNGILYVIGGVNASQVPVNTNFAYDPKTDTWSIKAPMPTARHHLQAVAVDGKIFALGGRILGDGVKSEDIDPTLSSFDRNEMYDPVTDSWTIREPMLTKRSGFAAVVPADGNIYVFGGQGVGELTGSVEKYDPVLDKWTYDKPMPVARYGIKAVAFNDRIYVLGGQLFDLGKVPQKLNEVFHIGKKVE